MSARVLVVDDERFFREAIGDVLDGAGIDWLAVESGAEALEQAADPTFGAVVLDLQLPDLHGLEVFRRLKEGRDDLRVVILSAHTDQDNVLEALRLGAFDYLAKPLHEEELVLAVRRALETHALASGWQRLRGRVDRLERVLEGLRASALADAPEAVHERAVAAAAEVLGAAKTSLLLLDEGAGELRVVAAQGSKLAPEEMDAVGLGKGVAGLALARSEPIVVADVTEDGRFEGRDTSSRYDTATFAVAPLTAGDRALGVLCAADPSDGVSFGPSELGPAAHPRQPPGRAAGAGRRRPSRRRPPPIPALRNWPARFARR